MVTWREGGLVAFLDALSVISDIWWLRVLAIVDLDLVLIGHLGCFLLEGVCLLWSSGGIFGALAANGLKLRIDIDRVC